MFRAATTTSCTEQVTSRLNTSSNALGQSTVFHSKDSFLPAFPFICVFYLSCLTPLNIEQTLLWLFGQLGQRGFLHEKSIIS